MKSQKTLTTKPRLTNTKKSVKTWVSQFIEEEERHKTPKKQALKWAKEILENTCG
jgi:hypothetical protein